MGVVHARTGGAKWRPDGELEGQSPQVWRGKSGVWEVLGAGNREEPPVYRSFYFYLLSNCCALSAVLTVMDIIPPNPPTTLRVGAVVIPTLRVRKRRFREVKSLPCGYTAPLRGSQDSAASLENSKGGECSKQDSPRGNVGDGWQPELRRGQLQSCPWQGLSAPSALPFCRP